jgi:hypothetical protein
MPPETRPGQIPVARALAVIILLFAMTGCASLDSAPERPSQGPQTLAAIAALQVADHLELLQRLVQGGPAEQAEILAGARAGYEAGQGGGARLRYGLVLACPAHPGRDLTLAQSVLREALSAPEELTVGERALAVVELQRLDAERRLDGESQRLATELDRERSRSRRSATTDANLKRLQSEMEENARLRRALDEAKAKLDAIANIERNITDRKPAAEGRRP